MKLALLCLALFVAISVSKKCPIGNKDTFEKAACFMAKQEDQDVELNSLFSHLNGDYSYSNDEVYVEKYYCTDIDRRDCSIQEDEDDKVNFNGEAQSVRITKEKCDDDSNSKCTTFYDVYLLCGEDWTKATIMVPSTEAAIFYEPRGCNHFPLKDSEDACPTITLSEQHDTEEAAQQGLVTVSATDEQQKKLRNAYFRYETDLGCVGETDYLQLPINSYNFDYYDLFHVYPCYNANTVTIQLVYQCKEKTRTSEKVVVDASELYLYD